MNQNTAFTKFCTYIMRYDPNYDKMSPAELGGFKRGTYKGAYDLIRKSAKYQDIDISNLCSVLYTLFMDAKPEDIIDDQFKLLEIIVNKNPSFGNRGKLGSINLEKLNEQLNKALQHRNQFNENIIDSTIASGQIQQQQQPPHINNPLVDKTFKTIRSLYKRLNQKESSQKVFEFHYRNGTMPEKLSINHFPPPFLPHDIIFIQKYNVLIKEFQEKITNLCKSRLVEQINKIKTDINSAKNQLQDLPDLDNKINDIKVDSENNAKFALDKALEKASKIIIREIVVKTNNVDEIASVDENWNFFHNPDRRSDDNQNSNNHHYSHSSRSRSRPNHRNNNNSWRNRSSSNWRQYNRDNSNNRGSSSNYNSHYNRNDQRNNNQSNYNRSRGSNHFYNRSTSTYNNRR